MEGSFNFMAEGLIMDSTMNGPKNRGDSFLESVFRDVFLVESQTFVYWGLPAVAIDRSQ